MKHCLFFILFLSLVITASEANYKDDIGQTQLSIELSGNVPDGTGVTATQVEAPEAGPGTLYQVNTGLSQFSSDFITDNSEFVFPDEGISGHSNTVGGYLYGSDSISSGISNIDLYEANHWLQSGYLRFNTSLAPIVETNDVVNHSWVGSFSATADTENVLRRFDYAISSDDFVAVVGVNNGSTDQDLLSSAYNVISVGNTNGSHASGDTAVDGAGRQRPHVVAPFGVTSWSTPVVGAAAAQIIETSRANAPLANGERSEVVKAIILAGATKDELSSWDDNNDSTQPLDNTYGAGELNVYNNYHILSGGEFDPSSISVADNQGWDFESVASSQDNYYFIDLPENFFTELSVSLTWNRVVTETVANNYSSLESELANLDLQLYEASGFTIGELVEQSNSPDENVEYLWLSSMAAGRYALKVSSASSNSTEYGLAWNSKITPVPEPATFTLLGVGLFSLFARRGFLRGCEKSTQ